MTQNYVVISSEGVSVAPHNAGAVSVNNKGQCPRGHVTVTPLSAVNFRKQIQKDVVIATPPNVKKVLLKVVNKKNSKEFKLFTLRNVKESDIISCENLKSLIRSQLYDDITKGSFDVGVVQSNSSVSFRSVEDLKEVWEQLCAGKNVTLWCDGMASNKKKRSRDCDTEEEEEYEKRKCKKSKKKDREEEVEELLEGLKAKHGTVYTPMQFRIWAEMIAGGVHISQDEPPCTTMFNRSGSVNVKKKTTSDVVTQAVDKLATVLSPRSASASSSGNSPAKIIENRSKCYKQLADLKNLHELGVLSDEEYHAEKESVMSSLKALK